MLFLKTSVYFIVCSHSREDIYSWFFSEIVSWTVNIYIPKYLARPISYLSTYIIEDYITEWMQKIVTNSIAWWYFCIQFHHIWDNWIELRHWTVQWAPTRPSVAVDFLGTAIPCMMLICKYHSGCVRSLAESTATQ